MKTIRLPQLQNIGSGQRVTLRLPLGVTYQKIFFWLGTNILTSLITDIVLKINNKEAQKWNSAADLITGLNAWRGQFTSNTSFFCLDFTERRARTREALEMGTIAAFAQAGVQDMTLEFTLGTYTPVAASTIEAWADVDPLPSANRLIQRVQVQQRVIAAAAEEQIYVPYGASGYQVKRLIIKNTALTSLRVRRDGDEQYESLTVARNNQRSQDYGLVPQAGYFVLDFMPDSLQSNAFNTAMILGTDGKPKPVENLDIRATVSGADTLTIYTESYSTTAQL